MFCGVGGWVTVGAHCHPFLTHSSVRPLPPPSKHSLSSDQDFITTSFPLSSPSLNKCSHLQSRLSRSNTSTQSIDAFSPQCPHSACGTCAATSPPPCAPRRTSVAAPVHPPPSSPRPSLRTCKANKLETLDPSEAL